MNIIKRELQLFNFFTKTLNNGISIFFKYSYFNFIWRLFNKSTAMKYTKKYHTILKFKNNHKLEFPWLLTFVSIYLDQEYSKFKEFVPKPGQTVIDLGANVGVYTYYAASRVGKSGHVIGAEPHPVNFEKLRKNIESNKLNQVKIVKAAITDKIGTLNFDSMEGMGSHKVDKKGNLKVETVPLKDLLKGVKTVDLLKMDIEGSEIAVLKSSKDIMSKIKKIVVETHNNEDEVITLLKHYNYNIKLVDKGRMIYASRDNF